MTEDRYPYGVLGPDDQELFVDWFSRLCDERLGGAPRSGKTGDAYTLGLTDGTELALTFVDEEGQVQVTQTGGSHDLRPLVKEAFDRGKNGDVGPGAWYAIALSCDPGLQMHAQMLRSLGEHRRYQGDWAITPACLLMFEQHLVEAEFVLLPKFDLEMRFLVPSPWHGPLGERRAAELGTFYRSVSAFATGAAFNPLNMPPMHLKPAEAKAAEDKLRAGVPYLPVDDVLLGPALEGLITDNRAEALERVKGALYAYEQAIGQPSEYVSIILLVTAIEALAVPNAPWRKNRLTRRFIEATYELIPEAIAEAMRHQNFQEAFGSTRSPKDFLDQLYDSRSRPLHSGLVAQQVFTMGALAAPASARIAIVSELARAALLNFLRRPFSSLYGHPSVDPPVDA